MPTNREIALAIVFWLLLAAALAYTIQHFVEKFW